jgi:hypothetical protein
MTSATGGTFRDRPHDGGSNRFDPLITTPLFVAAIGNF